MTIVNKQADINFDVVIHPIHADIITIDDIGESANQADMVVDMSGYTRQSVNTSSKLIENSFNAILTVMTLSVFALLLV